MLLVRTSSLSRVFHAPHAHVIPPTHTLCTSRVCHAPLTDIIPNAHSIQPTDALSIWHYYANVVGTYFGLFRVFLSVCFSVRVLLCPYSLVCVCLFLSVCLFG